MRKIRKNISIIRKIKIENSSILQDIQLKLIASLIVNKQKYIQQIKTHKYSTDDTLSEDLLNTFKEYNVSFYTRNNTYRLLKDFDSKISLTKIINTPYGVYLYQRSFNSIKQIDLNSLKYETEDLNYSYEDIGILKGYCILSPYIITQLIERLAFSLSDLFLIDNITFSCKNSVICKNKVSLYDIPLLQGGFFHRHYDDQLIKTKKKTLIKNGIANNYLSDVSFSYKNSGNSYYDEILNDYKMSFSNLYLRLPSNNQNIKASILIKDSFMPLKIDLFTGNIEGKVFGIDLINNKRIIGEFFTDYSSLFSTILKYKKYGIYQGHKLSYAQVFLGE